MGLPRKIEYSSYPVNYGLIPMTVLPTSRGGDGDALDVIILGDTLIQGKVVKVKILGLIKMIDSGEQDDKVIAVPVNGDLSKYENLNDFSSDYPETLNNISEWFEKYKGKNLVEFQSLGSKTEAIKLVKDSNRYFKKFGIRPRG